jgi:L-lysine exporter family protein LysE/ArgO
LGVAVATLGKRIQSARVWHWLDGAVAVMMWGTAMLLVRGLF